MTPKERVLAAIDHQEPDRVPLDFWPGRGTEARLLRHLDLESSDELQDFLGSDVRCVYPRYVGPKLNVSEDGSYEDFWGVIRKPYAHGSGGAYDEVVAPPLANATSLADIDKIRWPSPDWFDYSSLVEQCDRYRDYAVVVGKMGRETQTIFIQLWYYRGLAQILMDMASWPEFVEAMIDRIMAFRVEHIRRILAVVKGRADLLQIADDYGMQTGLMMSLDMWRQFFARRLKRIADMVHDAGLKVFLHCDGAIRPVIPDLIELGVDVLNPIQPDCPGMEPKGLKRDFGRKLCFHAGIDTQHTLPAGTTADVVSEVRQRIEVLGKGGGYILAPVHTVEADVPVENVLTLYEAAKEYGRRR